METPDATPDAARDLKLIREILERTEQRIDPHAFHFVWWGSIVLVWYPLANLFMLLGNRPAFFWTMAAALTIGSVGSAVMGYRSGRKPRLAGENTFISRQVGMIVLATVGTGIVLSPLAPAAGFIAHEHMPTMWGLVYAATAFMVGVVYRSEFLWAGAAIWAAALLAMFLPDYNGFIVGPAMGLGMIVPGVMAERRVRRLRAEGAADAGE
jgi:hypothetical protein